MTHTVFRLTFSSIDIFEKEKKTFGCVLEAHNCVDNFNIIKWWKLIFSTVSMMMTKYIKQKINLIDDVG